jgi:hypothetical protein
MSGNMYRIVRLLVWISMATFSGGCAAVAYTATLFPPEKIPAKYEFDEKSTLLVFVEDPKHLSDQTSMRTQLSECLIQEFEDRGLVERVIPYHQLMNLATATENFRSLSTAEVAKKLKADVVLYVEIDQFSLKDALNSPFWNGKCSTRVKVIGAEKGRLWPRDLPEGYQPPRVDTGSVSDEGSMRFEQHLVRNIAQEMSDNIMKLFYKHRGKEHGSLPEGGTEDRP